MQGGGIMRHEVGIDHGPLIRFEYSFKYIQVSFEQWFKQNVEQKTSAISKIICGVNINLVRQNCFLNYLLILFICYYYF